jgi:hypothetical protein
MLLAALELAVGKDQPNIPMIRSYDKDSRIVIFLPEVEIINYQNLVNEYAAERTALAAALSNSPVGCTRVNTPRP